MEESGIIKKYYRLTAAQKMLVWTELFFSEKENASAVSYMNFYFTVNNNPDCSALRRSFQKLLCDNDSLRIAVERKGIRYRQYVREYEETEPEVIALENEDDFEQYLKTLYSVRLPFCSDKHAWGAVVCYGDKASLVMRVHHLCMDGYSLKLIFDQLSAYYEAYSSGNEPSRLYDGKITDYFELQKEYMEGKAFRQDLKFWAKKYMHQRNYKMPVPRASIIGASDQHTIVLEPELCKCADEFCRAHSMSFTQLIMSAAGLVVYHMTKKDNFAMCMFTHGRRTDELRNTVGCMMNIYPVFYDINAGDTIDEYRKKEAKQYYTAMLHSRFPQPNQIPFTYYEAVKTGLRLNQYWIVFSNIDYAVASEKSDYGFVNITRNKIPFHFYCSVYEYCDHGEIKINYRSKQYSREKILEIESEFRKVLEKMMFFPDSSIQ